MQKKTTKNPFRDYLIALLGALMFILLFPFYLIVVLGNVFRDK